MGAKAQLQLAALRQVDHNHGCRFEGRPQWVGQREAKDRSQP